MGLDRMGEEEDDKDDAEEDVTNDTAAAAFEEGNAALEEKDQEMLVPEHEFPQPLEVILPEKEPEPPS
jgi:hypothetical protein